MTFPFPGPSIGAGATSLPAGTVGAWLADQIVTSNGRKVIPNQITLGARPVSQNLMPAPARLFNSEDLYYLPFGLTVTNNAAIAVNGLMEASTMQAPGGANWYLSVPSIAYPASGQYTMVIVAKSHDGTPWQFKQWFLGNGALSSSRTLTNSYQRFVFTATLAAGTESNTIFAISPDDSAGVWMDVDSVALYPGAVDLEPTGRTLFGGHVICGVRPYDPRPVLANGVADMSTDLAVGLAQWEQTDAPSIGASTTIQLVSETRDAHFQGGISKINAFVNFCAFQSTGNTTSVAHLFQYTSGGVNVAGAYYPTSRVQSLNKGWRYITGRLSSAGAGDIFYNRNDIVITANATPTASAMPAMLFNGLNNDNLTSGAKYAAMILVNRAITNSELSDTISALDLEFSFYGITPVTNEKYVVIHDGDSLSVVPDVNGYPYPTDGAALITLSPPVIDYAVNGSNQANLRARLTSVMTPIAATRAAGQTFFYVPAVGHNDLSAGYVGFVNPSNTGVVAWLQDYAWLLGQAKALGFTTVAVTITPSTVTGFNALRNTANATIVTWGGGNVCDYVFDLGNAPVIGPDAAASNTALYYDGTHFTPAAVGTYCGPDYAAFFNGILTP